MEGSKQADDSVQPSDVASSASQPPDGPHKPVYDVQTGQQQGSRSHTGKTEFPFRNKSMKNEDEKTSAADWAPQAPPPTHLPATNLPFLPETTPETRRVKGTTSRPYNLPLTPMQASLSYSLSRVLSLPRFAAFLDTPQGYAQFSAYLSSLAPQGRSLAELELWKDTRVLKDMLQQAGRGATAINEVYFRHPHDDLVPDLPPDVKRKYISKLRDARGSALGLDEASKHLLESLYRKEFIGFIKSRLVRHTKAQLAKYHLPPEDRGGIGSAFLLTNPRLPDDPIVLVSPGFEELTGYSTNQIIGRNCRFLQGKTTAPEAVNGIRNQLEHNDEVLQLVLNFRSSGAPFFNLLYIRPLRDREGNIAYFLGAQVDQTRALTTGTDLSLILPGDQDLHADMSSFSPAVQVEAQDVAKRPIPPTKEALDEEIPLPEGEDVVENGRGQQRGGGGGARATAVVQEVKEDVGLSIRKLFPCFGGKKRVEGEGGEEREGDRYEEQVGSRTDSEPRVSSEKEPLVPPLQKESRKVSLEQRMLDMQVTYERVAIVKRTTHEILFTSAGFLRSLGLPGTTRQEVDRSPLVFHNLLDLIVAPSAPNASSTATKELRDSVKTAFEQAKTTNLVCRILYKPELLLTSTIVASRS
ncbi:potassium voltage-gated channel Eag-related subfamily H member 8 [Rhodotorula toruloides]|uniref:Potassium voltage-gated channel Eag-related subfamily H member 8 n=1 Tax=Rhodotorula toruloides TaxID=5286 RepID=A0A511KDS6_RHOTO|nr:potassium voltage-gated channel Eag-related subfamily H member 8 [Rhodotorula toruloides]